MVIFLNCTKNIIGKLQNDLCGKTGNYVLRMVNYVYFSVVGCIVDSTVFTNMEIIHNQSFIKRLLQIINLAINNFVILNLN